MNKRREFSFGTSSIASAYDNALVPILFEPWAVRLIEGHGPWEGRCVLDLATGTGIVAQLVAGQVGSRGQVFASDINGEMLALARRRCSGQTPAVEFVECPAHPLEIPDESMDVVVCQQGFQFFPDRSAAAGEIYRVLREGGKVIATTWRPVTECQFFGSICGALERIGEQELSEMMRVPFDAMPGEELVDHFKGAGFDNVRIETLKHDLVIDGGIPHAVRVTYSTPIGPELTRLPEPRRVEFEKALTGLLDDLCDNGTCMGVMATNLLSAEKAAR